MKKLLWLLVPLALACGGKPGPSPEPTPAPVAVTEVPQPCRPGAHGPDGVIFSGDCQLTEKCKDSGDGFYVGECETRK